MPLVLANWQPVKFNHSIIMEIGWKIAGEDLFFVCYIKKVGNFRWTPFSLRPIKA